MSRLFGWTRSAHAIVRVLVVATSVAATTVSATVYDVALHDQAITFYGADALPAGFFGDRLAAQARPFDLSGDGVPDVALSAQFADGVGGTRPDAGEIHVYFGPRASGEEIDLLTLPADIIVYGARASDYLFTPGGADFNQDGRADLILGAQSGDGPGATRADAGTVLVLFGPLATGSVIDLGITLADVTIHGADPGDFLTPQIAADVDGDGHSDLVMVAYQGDGPANSRPESGEAYVLYGPFASGTTIDLRTDPADVTAYGADAGDLLSWAAVAPLNDDGRSDLALGAFGSFGAGNLAPYAGEVRILFGPLAPIYDLRTDADATIYGSDPDDGLGTVLTTADFDGDGRADLAATASGAYGPGNARPFAGEAYVFFAPLIAGESDASAAGFTVFGARDGDGLRYATAGDLNGDGQSELLLGADFANAAFGTRPGAGEVYALGGPLTRGGSLDLLTESASITVFGADAAGGALPDLLGIVAAGDVDDDGIDDMVASAQFADGPGNLRDDCGEVYVFLGSACLLPPHPPVAPRPPRSPRSAASCVLSSSR